MKKVLALILALTLTAVCFVGCSKKKADGDIPTLVWYVPGDAQEDIDIVMEAANKIVEKEIGARIDLKFLDQSAFSQKMELKMASKDDFDLCFTGYINVYSKAAKLGGLEPLDELLKLTPDLVEAVPQFYWDAAKVDGKIYAVPNQQIVASQKCPFIPVELVEKYNLDVDSITEYAQLEPFMKQVYENEEGIWPWRNRNAYFKVNGTFEEIVPIGVAIDKDSFDGEAGIDVVFTDNHESFLEGMRIRYSWFEKGYIRKDVLSATDDNSDYLAGKYAMDIQTYKPGVEVNVKNTLGKEVVAVKNITKPYIGSTACQQTMIGIGKNSKHKEEAMKFIELINTNKELYNIICFGIEGVHYDLNEDGFVVKKEDSKYAPEADWKFGNQFNALVREGADADVWEQTEALNNKAVELDQVSPILGFSFDNSKVEAEITALTAYRKEKGTAYFVGAKSIEDGYDDYIQGMYDRGLEKVINEAQRQVDAFLEEKVKNSK